MGSLSAETGGFNRHAIPCFEICNVGPDFDDCASRLVTQHLWFLDEVVTDPTVSVCVQLPKRASTETNVEIAMRPGTDIATTDSSYFDLDQYVVVADLRDGRIANLDGRRLQENAGPVRGSVDGHRPRDALGIACRDGHSSGEGIGIVIPCPTLLSRAKSKGKDGVSGQLPPSSFRGTLPAGEVRKPVSIGACAIVSRMQWGGYITVGAASSTEDLHDS